MSKVQILRGMPARRTEAAWRYLEAMGCYVDPQTGEVEHPDTTRIRRENLATITASDRNPAPTYSYTPPPSRGPDSAA